MEPDLQICWRGVKARNNSTALTISVSPDLKIAWAHLSCRRVIPTARFQSVEPHKGIRHKYIGVILAQFTNSLSVSRVAFSETNFFHHCSTCDQLLAADMARLHVFLTCNQGRGSVWHSSGRLIVSALHGNNQYIAIYRSTFSRNPGSSQSSSFRNSVTIRIDHIAPSMMNCSCL